MQRSELPPYSITFQDRTPLQVARRFRRIAGLLAFWKLA
jgi:hypothetical protein